MKHKRYLLRNCGSLDGKTVIVTGATGTIGREICVCCLMLGADVIMAVRNMEKGDITKQRILKYFFRRKKDIDSERIIISKLDVSDFTSISEFIKTLEQKQGYFLVNNAGVLSGKSKNPDYQMHYLTNFLGQMYLSVKLEQCMQKIVFQSSLSYAWKKAHLNWNDVQGVGVRRNLKKYAQSKRLLNLAVTALDNPKYCLVHPGICSTNIIPTRLLRVLCRPVFHSARTAALCAVVALCKHVPQNHILAPRFFGIWGKPKLYKIQNNILHADELENARKNFADEITKLDCQA